MRKKGGRYQIKYQLLPPLSPKNGSWLRLSEPVSLAEISSTIHAYIPTLGWFGGQCRQIYGSPMECLGFFLSCMIYFSESLLALLISCLFVSHSSNSQPHTPHSAPTSAPRPPQHRRKKKQQNTKPQTLHVWNIYTPTLGEFWGSMYTHICQSHGVFGNAS